MATPEHPRDEATERREQPVCSAKGCRADATHAVVWNNPKVHVPGREKLWHACDEHRQSLADHLDVRGFLLRVDPVVSGDGSR